MIHVNITVARLDYMFYREYARQRARGRAPQIVYYRQLAKSKRLLGDHINLVAPKLLGRPRRPCSRTPELETERSP
jgi:hypothetical protein